MDYEISGEIAQQARVRLNEGDWLWTTKGTLMGYTGHVRWYLKVPGGASGAARRLLSGEGIALTRVEADADGQEVLLAANNPGHIRAWDLNDGALLATRGALLGAWGPDLNIDVTVAKRAGAALFGGAGLFLQRLSGQGTVLIHGSGDFDQRDLVAGQEIFVSTGNLAAFADSVDYNIRGVAGFRQMLFGGEGLFMTRLEGPGRVLLQTLKRG